MWLGMCPYKPTENQRISVLGIASSEMEERWDDEKEATGCGATEGDTAGLSGVGPGIFYGAQLNTRQSSPLAHSRWGVLAYHHCGFPYMDRRVFLTISLRESQHVVLTQAWPPSMWLRN